MTWADLHVAVREWLRWRLGEPTLYGMQLAQMPGEWYCIFRFCQDWWKEHEEEDLDEQVKKLVGMQLARLPG